MSCSACSAHQQGGDCTRPASTNWISPVPHPPPSFGKAAKISSQAHGPQNTVQDVQVMSINQKSVFLLEVSSFPIPTHINAQAIPEKIPPLKNPRPAPLLRQQITGMLSGCQRQIKHAVPLAQNHMQKQVSSSWPSLGAWQDRIIEPKTWITHQARPNAAAKADSRTWFSSFSNFASSSRSRWRISKKN